MFSVKQKQEIAAAVEKVLLSFDHPEMPKDKPVFKLHIDGKESWSWADIEPNWTYEDRKPSVNEFNEMQARKPKPIMEGTRYKGGQNSPYPPNKPKPESSGRPQRK